MKGDTMEIVHRSGGAEPPALPDVGASIGAVTGGGCCASFGGAYYTWQCYGCSCEGYGQSWDVVATWEGYSRLFSWMEQCPCQRAHEEDPEYWIGLSATSVVVTNGTRGSVSASFNPPESAGDATATSASRGIPTANIERGSGHAEGEDEGRH